MQYDDPLIDQWFPVMGDVQLALETGKIDPAEAHRIAQAQRDAGDTPIYVLSHGYGPLEDYRARTEVAWQAAKHGMWVNRYAYLTDEKLVVLGSVTNG